jgi:molecular chaperone HtpG
VRVTTRLVDSPACIVVDEGDMSAHLARMLKQAGQDAPRPSRSSKSMPSTRWSSSSPTTARFDDLAQILFDQALLAEGGQLEDPAAYVQRVTKLLA